MQHTATQCNTLQHTETHIQTFHTQGLSCADLSNGVATHRNTLQHTATQCNTMQHTVIHCNKLQHTSRHFIPKGCRLQISRIELIPMVIAVSRDLSSTNCRAMCCVLQCVAVCCSVLQCVAVCCSVLQHVAVCCSALQCVAVCCSVLQNVSTSVCV